MDTEMYKMKMWMTISLAMMLVFQGHAEVLDFKNVLLNEISMLDNLINATEYTLNQQIKLRELIKKYQEIQARVLQGDDSNEVLFNMAKYADIILKTIKDNHLTQTFDPAFLGELSLVSKPAAKKGIPKP
jgi:hypothetical protein